MKRTKMMTSVLIVLTAAEMAHASLAAGDFGTSKSLSNPILAPMSKISQTLPAGSVIALNRETILNGEVYDQGTEMIVDQDGLLSAVRNSKVLETGANIKDLMPSEYTLLVQNGKTGEIEAYNLPDDFKVAGPGGHRRKRGGVTNCYHVVKAIVRRRITLTGVAAYMAAPQLRRAHWRRYANYNSAPYGSVCVFAAGGKVTSSGGHRYGHVGVKGAGGVANPMSGFHLRRPFLGCWNER